KASIKFAGLNIKGHGSMNFDDARNKWSDIRLMVLQKQIGVLVVGEAHMDDERRDEITRIHGNDLKIFYSKLPDSRNKAGIAVVFNMRITNTIGIQMYEVVAGHAIIIETNWHNDERISILAVYAPNTDSATNAAFWGKIEDFYDRHPRIKKPNILLGDLNMVEEPLDRLPACSDPTAITSSFDSLKCSLQLEDGWTNTYPDTLKYTFKQNISGQRLRHSRLDRIYIRAQDMEHTFEWKIEQTAVDTDHSLVSVRFTSETAPVIGRGRWISPPHLMYDKAIMTFIETEGIRAENMILDLEAQDEWDANHNAQTVWADFKKRFVELARKRSKIVMPHLTKKISELEAKIDIVSNDPELSEDERAITTAMLNEALASLEKHKHKTTRVMAKARNALQGETISRYWSNANKSKSPRDLIQRLMKPQTQSTPQPEYTTSSPEMADMLGIYHGNLQKDPTPPDVTLREQTTARILGNITKKLSEPHCQNLKEKLTDENIEYALKLSANYKAPGLDGISYEIWKLIHARYKNAIAHDRAAFNLIQTLRIVYNDIECNGMAPNTKFSESWMCPLYKKNDRAQMANYRPISLLNTDYKIMSKALTIKL
ncbi:hypothetical protein BT96DRAFT_756146, partial [Gymnopus androsaceus JB14]